MSSKNYPDLSSAWATEIYCDIRYVDPCIIDTHLDVLVSPLHDKDVKIHKDEICGRIYYSNRLKKPHRHIEFLFPRPVSLNTFDYMLKNKIERHGFQCVGRERLNSAVGYARYLCHLDNKEKAQYKTSDIIYYGRASPDILNLYQKTKIDEFKDYQQVISDIIKHRITNMIDLERYYQVTNPDMLYVMYKQHSKIKDFVRDNYYKQKQIEDGWKRQASIHHDIIHA